MKVPQATSRARRWTRKANQRTSRDVWRLLEQDADFIEGMRESAEDYAAGRVAPFRHRREHP